MKVFLTHSYSETCAFFVLGNRISEVRLMSSAYDDGVINVDHYRYINQTQFIDLMYLSESQFAEVIRQHCEARHERQTGQTVTGFKEIPISSVICRNVRVDVLMAMRGRITGEYFHSKPYILARSASTIKIHQVEMDAYGYGVPSRLRKFRRQSAELGALIGEAVRGECDDLAETLERIIDLAEDLKSYCYGLLERIAALDIGLTVPTCGHLEVDGEEQAVADSGGRLRDTACRSCFDDSDVVVYCVDDGYRHWRDNVYYWESDDEYHLTEESDDDDYDEGSSGSNPDARLDYSADVMRFLSKDVSFTSTAHGDFHMGIELETAAKDYGVSISNKVAQVRDELGKDYLVCKYDGSVGDLSMEWVTRPTNLATHIEKFGKWQSTDGMVAWNNRSCGMHIHIDSKAFTALTLGKMIQFYNKEENADFIRSIAGRHPLRDNQASEYAALDNSRVVHSPTHALKGKDPSRYRMINCENLSSLESARLGLDTRWGDSNTVEIRIFRASLKKARLLAQIEFAHSAIMFCRVTSYRDLTSKSFLKWLRTSAGMYPNLAKWFDINNRHGSTVTNADPIAKAAHLNQPELFAEAA